MSEAEALIGKINLERLDGTTMAYINRNIRVLETRIKGKTTAGADSVAECQLVSELKHYLERNTDNESN